MTDLIAIASQLADMYDVDKDTAYRGVLDVVKTFEEKGILESE